MSSVQPGTRFPKWTLLAVAVLTALAACTVTPLPPTRQPQGTPAAPGGLSPYPSGPLPTTGSGSLYPCPDCRPTREAPALVQDAFVEVGDEQLRATYYTPSYAPAPALILLHQNGGSKEDYTKATQFAQALQQAGFAVVAVDMRGFGQTGGQVDWAKSRADVPKIVTWLSQQASVDPDRIGIMGASVGSSLALVAAADDARVKAVVLLSPGLNYMGIETVPAAARYDGPMLIVYSSEDTQVGDTPARLVAAHTGNDNHPVITLTGAGHGTGMLVADQSLGGQIVEWLQSVLQ